MPEQIRVVSPNSVYEIVSRAREGLPLPPTQTTNEIVQGIYARAVHQSKVTLCNFVFMDNHKHDHVIPHTPPGLSNYVRDSNRGMTQALKALLGFSYLHLWEDRATIALMPRLEDVLARLVYLFCNPAKAGLVDSIDEYPGLSSWRAFKTCEPSIDAEVSVPARCYHKAAIPKLPEGNRLTPEQDQRFVDLLRRSDECFEHDLVVKPFAWLGQFGITDAKQIESIRQRVIKMVYEREREYREAREYPPIGRERLRSREYFAPHTPEKKGRKVFVLCSDPDTRVAIIAMVKAVRELCRECYENAKRGLNVTWPQGVFIPWLPPREFHAGSP